MTVKQRLRYDDIRHACSDISFTRGRRYFEEGLVLSLEIDEESDNFVHFHTSIKGRMATPYEQSVKLDFSTGRDAPDIDGSCSCPMHYNCKHVAAACLKYLQEGGETNNEPTAGECLEWLEKLQQQSGELPDSDQKGSFLAYVLTPSTDSPEISIHLVITSNKKSGGLNRGKEILLRTIFLGYSRPDYLSAEDEELIRLLKVAISNYHGQPLITGSMGHLTLQAMLSTGRCFWKNLENEALIQGEERQLEIEWNSNDQQEYQLDVRVAPRGVVVLSEPPLYIDPAEHKAGALQDSGFDAQQLKLLLQAPSVPQQHVDEFSKKMVIDLPQVKLPPPTAVKTRNIRDIDPIPLLTLYADEINGYTTHMVVVQFIYDEVKISPLLESEQVVINAKKEIIRLSRSLESEEEALQQLSGIGLKPSRELNADDLALYFDEDSVLENAAKWHQFIEEEIPHLQSLGWRIVQEESFELNFHDAEEWHAGIEEKSQNNWFELSFDIKVNGKVIPLLPLITQILQTYDVDDLPETLTTSLGDNDYLKLPSKTIRPVLRTLHELYDSASKQSDEKLRLSLFDAAQIADLESDGLFSLKGGKTLRKLGRKLRDFKGIADVQPPETLQAELRNYQQQGLNWLQFLREFNLGGVLADDMGLGKTIQTLAHLLVEKKSGRMQSPCLIVAPTSLMGNWRREAQRFTPELSVVILQGSERHQHFENIGEYDLVLTTYPLLSRDTEVLQQHDYHYLILDEAQTIKNPRAKAARLVRTLKANHRLCLTGTPMENHLGELWALFDFLMPGFLGNMQFFNRHYRTSIEKHGDSGKRRLLSKRVKPFMLRRTKGEVAKELPPKTEMIRSIPLGKQQAVLYESIRLSMEQKVRQTIKSKGLARSHITILDALLKLRQCCCDPSLLSLEQAKQVKESAKLELLMDLLPELLEEGRRILLFSQFTSMLAIIEKQLKKREISYAKLTGQTRKRDEVIECFTEGKVDLFLISLKAGGIGLNLTAADTVILYDPWWNPAVESQAMDRAHRIGQENPVFVYKLITENTVEEKILAMQERKRSLAEGIYDESKQEGQWKLSADELSELFTRPAEG
ncbi:MAG: SNF2 helicase associated domain-containing protein [Gammaproteobacteria bacterium]|nr:SNF2 helicase associated domain-containing protein [Gammaproteobacteria bacterium]